MACPVLTLFSQREDRINQHTCIRRGKKLVRAAFEGEGCVFLRRSLEGLSTARVNRGLEKSEKESFEFFNFQVRGSLLFLRIDFRDGTSGNGQYRVHSRKFQIVWILNKYKIQNRSILCYRQLNESNFSYFHELFPFVFE